MSGTPCAVLPLIGSAADSWRTLLGERIGRRRRPRMRSCFRVEMCSQAAMVRSDAPAPITGAGRRVVASPHRGRWQRGQFALAVVPARAHVEPRSQPPTAVLAWSHRRPDQTSRSISIDGSSAVALAGRHAARPDRRRRIAARHLGRRPPAWHVSTAHASARNASPVWSPTARAVLRDERRRTLRDLAQRRPRRRLQHRILARCGRHCFPARRRDGRHSRYGSRWRPRSDIDILRLSARGGSASPLIVRLRSTRRRPALSAGRQLARVSDPTKAGRWDVSVLGWRMESACRSRAMAAPGRSGRRDGRTLYFHVERRRLLASLVRLASDECASRTSGGIVVAAADGRADVGDAI